MPAFSLANSAQDLRRLLILLAVYAIAANFALTASVLADPDIWWHLRTGQWMLEHGAVPMTDPFAQGGAAKPWVAYSWLFELLAIRLYQKFGLAGILIYKVPVLLGIVWSVLALLRRLGQSFVAATCLTVLSVLTLTPLLTPRPWLLTILFFTLELHLLLDFRQTGRRRWMWLLPLLFALWANVHIQFIYGFLPLLLVVAEPVFEARSWVRVREAVSLCPWWLLPTCGAATLLTPYHWRLYRPVLEITQQARVYEFVLELQSMNFRHPAHWIMLGLVLWAAFRLGSFSGRRVFPVLFLLAAAALSFRANRDVWVAAIAAVTALALTRSADESASWQGVTNVRLAIVFALGCLLAFWVGAQHRISNATLQDEVARSYPIAAARIVAERRYAGPLYNHFNWGGYLIWRLPHLPVNIDGRTNLYGAETIQQSLDTWAGKLDWASDPALSAAGLVIADVRMPLCSLLRFDQRFELVYEDAVAAVFRKRP